MRTTGGKKIYYYDPKTGGLPPPKFNETTKLAETRQKILYRAEDGKPLHRKRDQLNFIPSSQFAAREATKHKTGGLFNEEYDLKREKDKIDCKNEKNKRLHGDFKLSYYFDNGTKVD